MMLRWGGVIHFMRGNVSQWGRKDKDNCPMLGHDDKGDVRHASERFVIRH